MNILTYIVPTFLAGVVGLMVGNATIHFSNPRYRATEARRDRVWSIIIAVVTVLGTRVAFDILEWRDALSVTFWSLAVAIGVSLFMFTLTVMLREE